MIKIKYLAHYILQSRYKMLIYVIIYLIIIYIYNFSFHDLSISDCMQRSTTSTTSDELSVHDDYTQFLEEQAWRMDQRISELERSRLELERENAVLKAAIKRLSARLSVIETNKEIRLIKEKVD